MKILKYPYKWFEPIFKRQKILFLVERFERPVDCEWSEWRNSPCSVTCGKGHHGKTRTKLLEEGNGGICKGESFSIEACIGKECPGKIKF